jgi:NAD(P)-dependent dehydrogenase (short-subunit alcohol dehydrogenase family)
MAAQDKGAVVISGASKGIGEACALHLDALGFRVFAGVRKVEDAKALQAKASENLTPIFLDVTNHDQISAASLHVKEKLGERGLAGLVNNAGIAVAAPMEYIPIAELRRQMEVNFIGQVAVTRAFMPLLRLGHGRIINMSSISGKFVYPFFGAYAASKHALEAFTDALRRELLPWDMPVVSVEPGAVKTPIWDTSLDRAEELLESLPAKAHALYGQAAQRATDRAMRNGENGSPPLEVAAVVAEALTARRPKTRYPVASGAKQTLLLARLLPDRWFDWIVKRAFYQ